MKKRLFPYLSVMALVLAPSVYAQGVDLGGEERDMVRVMRHPDGARSIYQRQAGWRGMRCSIYGPSGKLAAVNDYIEGKYGQLVACNIYDYTKKNIIYRVSYGYDSQARLIEERMFSNPDGKLVQRVIYKYDANGNRSKPLIISLSNSSSARKIAPTRSEEVDRTHKQLQHKR